VPASGIATATARPNANVTVIISPLGLHGWKLVLQAYKLELFENKVLTRIFVSKKNDIIKEWR
jgi:hypothetical protein